MQAATYVYIDECSSPMNQVMTLFGYLHVAFQPFFVNMVAMYFIPESVKLKIRTTAYTLCAVAAVAMIVKMFPFAWAGLCIIGTEGFCGDQVCSVSGAWLFGFDWGLHVFVYILAAFVMPVIYGSWRFVAFHYVVGPWISDITTDDLNEYAAVWCLFSIVLCVSVIKTPIRKYLHVQTWPFYKRTISDSL
ncbi:DUF5765 domain-containing protein [Bathymodiolus japonicus methanotrophic gill symbiont]|uniref:DUF5765 domain-containing protein n=1 Tax=Bathymodiolus japonicus methanotrophic gill symbiont TaxID=113269 RepID=UPI003B82CE0F